MADRLALVSAFTSPCAHWRLIEPVKADPIAFAPLSTRRRAAARIGAGRKRDCAAMLRALALAALEMRTAGAPPRRAPFRKTNFNNPLEEASRAAGVGRTVLPLFRV